MERHGVFVHKGVGKGYKMMNGMVVRYATSPVGPNGPRVPVDWFNVIIDQEATIPRIKSPSNLCKAAYRKWIKMPKTVPNSRKKIVDKQIEIANDNQKRLDAIYESGVELSPVQREQLNFNNELKKLNIFHKQKKELTTNEYLAYKVLAKQHQQNLDKLDAAAIKEGIRPPPKCL